MNDDKWLELFSELNVQGKVHSVSDADMDRFEVANHFRLSSTYRSFCHVFGPGELCECYSIAVPEFSAKADEKWIYDLGETTKSYHNKLEWQEYSSDPEQFQRGIIFCSDHTGAVYFWDPTIVTSSKASEYAIFATYRGWELERLCDTFWEFIQICVHKHTKRIYQDPPEMVFLPAKSKKRRS